MKKNTLYIILSLLSGVLLAFSFPNFIENTLKVHTTFFMWFAFVPVMYVAIKKESVKSVFWHVFLSAAVFYMTGLYWLWFVGPMGAGAYAAWFVLACYFASVYAFSFAAAKYLDKKIGLDFIFTLPVIITFMEFAREWLFTGWPALTPAQSQYQFTPVIQILSITGIPGLNYILISVNCLIASYIARRSIEFKKTAVIVWSAVFVMLLVLLVVSNSYINKGTKSIKAALMQPNINQNVQWTPEYRKYTMDTMKGLYASIEESKPSLIVWPETGYPGILNMEGKKAGITGWIKGAFALVGSDKALKKNGRFEYYNAAYMMDPNGAITGEYLKFHLVPFGEYIPLQEALPFVKKVVQRYDYTGFTRGTKIEPLEFDGVKIGPIICYDSYFPNISREHARKGAKLLAHLSYETWYGVSPAAAQIFSNVALRAVENRVHVIRSVASGISGFVTDKGEITVSTRLFEKTALVNEFKIRENAQISFYTRFGDWFAWLMLALLAVLVSMKMIKK